MNIIIYTEKTMASNVSMREVVRQNHDKIKAIVFSNQIKGNLNSQFKIAHKLIKKSSFWFFYYKLIESKLYHLLLPIFRLTKPNLSLVALAKKYNIPIIKTNDVNHPAFLKKIKSLYPDYIIVSISQIFKKETFQTLGKKLINVHASYLPEYRGPSQYIWYLINNNKQFGITLHFLDQGLDTGDIIMQEKFDIPKPISAYKLHYNISKKYSYMINKFLTLNKITSKKQNNQEATFTHMPTKKDFKEFFKHNKLITIKDLLTCK